MPRFIRWKFRHYLLLRQLMFTHHHQVHSKTGPSLSMVCLLFQESSLSLSIFYQHLSSLTKRLWDNLVCELCAIKNSTFIHSFIMHYHSIVSLSLINTPFSPLLLTIISYLPSPPTKELLVRIYCGHVLNHLNLWTVHFSNPSLQQSSHSLLKPFPPLWLLRMLRELYHGYGWW